MSNLESGVHGEVSKPGLRGREAFTTGEVLGVQIMLMGRMVPKGLEQHLGTGDGVHVGIEDRLFERWAKKYSALFKDFCDENADNEELIMRLRTGSMTEGDAALVRAYLEDPVKQDGEIGGLYFKDSTEVKGFLS
jgi:hypothetical protein